MEALLFPLFNVCIGEANRVIGVAKGVAKDVIWIEEELLVMRRFLEDADARQIHDERLRKLVRQIRRLCFEAEDVLASFNDMESLRRVADPIGLHKIDRAILRIKSSIRRISRFSLPPTSTAIDRGQAKSIDSRSAHFFCIPEGGGEESLVGLQGDLEMLLPRLIDGERRRRVISIVGMGGSGKTALAKLVFNCIHVRHYFRYRAFVRMTPQSRIREILIGILMGILDPSLPEMDDISKMRIPSDKDLAEKLFSYLRRERYLVVIDDIQSMEAWDALICLLPDCSNGSRVLLTTRNRDIASISDPSHPHEVRLLDDEESWELFLKIVFPQGHAYASFPDWWEGMRRQILSKCGGLPAAILELGSRLCKSEMKLNAWLQVLKNETWQLTEGSTLEMLTSSYYDLPHYLKRCFLYLGLFPQDFEICSKKLIKLWIVEGFVQERGKENMEDVADDCLKELISKCMVQVVIKKHNGFPRTCRIHNLLRELIISQAEERSFFKIEGNVRTISSSTHVRRLAIHQNSDQYGSRASPFLRSILSFPKCGLHLSRLLHRSVNFLKVLDLEGVRIQGKTLPKKLGKAIHLRYLNLRNTGIETLPSSIGNLVNLETLDLRDNHINPVPNVILKLTELRVLHLDADTTSMDGDSLNVSPLTKLRILTIRVGKWMDDHLHKLADLRNLRIYGDLDLCQHALRNRLPKMSSLESLRVGFGFGDNIPNLVLICDNSHLRHLDLKRRLYELPHQEKFHPNLTSLFLKWSQLKQDPMEILEKLPNLQVLRLGCESFLGKKMACSAIAFRNLQLLELNLLNGLEEWRVEKGALPKLRRLVIHLCKQLKMLPSEMQHLNNLEELEVAGMSDMFNIRLKQNGEEDWTIIKHVRSVSIDGIQMSGASALYS